MLRSLLVCAVAAGVLCGCGSSYKNVENGEKGATSPRESGIYGANAEQAPPYGNAQKAAEEHKIVPIKQAFTNGDTDPTMEGSGNIAGQGSFQNAKQNNVDPPTWNGNTAQ